MKMTLLMVVLLMYEVLFLSTIVNLATGNYDWLYVLGVVTAILVALALYLYKKSCSP